MKVAVFIYSQSGQAKEAAKQIFEIGMKEAESINKASIVFKTIIPKEKYPFPWDKISFFDAFPETRLGLPPSGIEPIELSDIHDANLVAIVGQSWFLSPSLPLQSFFNDQNIRNYLRGKNVVFVNVCRNMWLKTSLWIKKTLTELNARFVGHIVLQDNHPNLISAASIVRWLIHGQKEASLLLPSAGVSTEDLISARHFGNIIKQAITTNNYNNLQSELLSAGAIKYNPSILNIEKMGYRMFGFWAKFIQQKGDYKDSNRRIRVQLFYYYLIVALFFISPFAQLFFYLTYPIHQVQKNKKIDCAV